jgi:hypothetical protein
VIRYLASGVLIGTVLRGIGLFPSLELEGVSILSTKLPSQLAKLTESFSSPEAFFWSISLIVLLLIFLTIASGKRRKEYLRLACIGLLWCSLFFILPALGRAQFGPSQALAPRYHYGSIFGLMLILSGAFDVLLSKRKLLSIITVLIFTANLYLARQYDRYTALGINNREYISKLQDWRNSIKGSEQKGDFRFDAKGSEHFGQQPRWVDTLTTGVNSEIIYDILIWPED